MRQRYSPDAPMPHHVRASERLHRTSATNKRGQCLCCLCCFVFWFCVTKLSTPRTIPIPPPLRTHVCACRALWRMWSSVSNLCTYCDRHMNRPCALWRIEHEWYIWELTEQRQKRLDVTGTRSLPVQNKQKQQQKKDSQNLGIDPME